jgi:sugar phosphate permease
VMFGMVRIVPRLIGRLGALRVLTAGLAVALVGMAWLSRLSADSPFFPQLALPLVLLGAGMGVALAPLTASGVAGVSDDDAGAASGLVNVAHQLGGALGLGVSVAVFASAPNLAEGVSTALTGAAVFLGLALSVVLLVMARPGDYLAALSSSTRRIRFADTFSRVPRP